MIGMMSTVQRPSPFQKPTAWCAYLVSTIDQFLWHFLHNRIIRPKVEITHFRNRAWEFVGSVGCSLNRDPITKILILENANKHVRTTVNLHSYHRIGPSVTAASAQYVAKCSGNRKFRQHSNTPPISRPNGSVPSIGIIYAKQMPKFLFLPFE